MKLPVLIALTLIITGTLLACSDTTSEKTGVLDPASDCPMGTASYIGCWLTPGCQSIAANNPSVQQRWGRDKIYLDNNNQFRIYRQAYDDSSCNGPLAFSSLGQIYNFTLTSSIIGSSGLLEYQIQVDSNDTGATQTSYTVYMAPTTNDTLCLSDNWDVNDEGFSYLFMDGTAVNFSNCLNKVQ